MYHFTAFTAVSLAISVAALVIPRTAPTSSWSSALEQYDVYHTRYIALDCPSKHDTSFFDQCCHPLMTSQSLDTRPAECTPNDNSNADIEDDGCDDNTTTPVPPETTVQGTPTSTPTSTPTPVLTQTPEPPASSASAPVATPTSSSGTDLNKGGVATFFYQGGNAGACGTVHSDSDFVAALDSARYDNGAFCGKQVLITNTDNQQSVTVTVADECPTCENANSIDLSVAAFQQLGDLSTGVLPIVWSFTS